MAVHYLLLVTGLLLLFISGKFLVESSVAIATYFRIPTMIIGLTIVAFGTSSPELLVSLQAALRGFPEIAVGNVVGSNIANILLVLALTAIIFPVAVPVKSLKRDWTIMMFVSVLFFVLILDEKFSRWEGLILFVLLVIYIIYSILDVRKENSRNGVMPEKKINAKWWVAAVIFLVSVAGLAYGADLFVRKAALIAEALGISQRVISVSMVAVGTSIPELATSVIAAVKKETGISLGNILGSNLMNLVSVIGLTGLIAPINVEHKLAFFDTPWMLGTALLLLVLMVVPPALKITRWKGTLMLLSYLLYLYLIF
ncbi:MAG: calcium/sodium antiporter [Bacteroidales bacterium]|nr:calcium/sodium antiporter [Bacteroidales bacterium]MBN2698575.1 calcium/sodium antiporter [Bacteroidales bacterium]